MDISSREKPSLRKKISKLVLKRSNTEPNSLDLGRAPISSPIPSPITYPPASVRSRPRTPNRSQTRYDTPYHLFPQLPGQPAKSRVVDQENRRPEPSRSRSKTEVPKPKPNMSVDFLKPRVQTGPRLRQAQDAKNMQQLVEEKCTSKGINPPNYEFLELIGKGNYGRVYKSKNRTTQELVAVKIIEVDKQDYQAGVDFRDDTIKEFIRETSILQSLKDNRAKNVNIIHDAFAVDTQLWIVSEYCPGGSLSTLIKASPRKNNGVPCLEEGFIVPIAREVAIALKAVHEAGVIHRDIKCANILVTEDGRIQLCDFGVSGFLENEVSKRTTIIGTPHWMAPELVPYLGVDDEKVRVQYGIEIDIWAFGCAVFEMATGFPPNHRTRVPDLRLIRESPRLEGDLHTDPLKDFVSFVLELHPDKRPSASLIIDHPYVKDTEDRFPTESIRILIERFARWEESGNQRESLFNPYGAAAPGEMPVEDPATEAWNFSTSIEFEKRMSMGLDPFGGQDSEDIPEWQKAYEKVRIARGENAMKRIFDINDKPYSFGDQGPSDLPFRNLENGAGAARDRTTLIDLDMAEFGEEINLDLDNVPTIRARRNFTQTLYDDDDDGNYDPSRTSKRFGEDNANRRTQDWTFPSMAAAPAAASRNSRVPDNRRTLDWSFDSAQQEATSRRSYANVPEPVAEEFERPSLMHAKTMPANAFGHSSEASSPDRGSLIDLDSALSINIPEISRPTTADSTAESAMSGMTSGDPFDLEDLEDQLSLAASNRGSLHMKSQSEPTAAFQSGTKGHKATDPHGASADQAIASAAAAALAAHNRSSSTTRSELDRSSNGTQYASPAKRQRWPALADSGVAVSDPAIQAPWTDPFSAAQAADEAEQLREERRGWERKLGHRRRVQTSTSSRMGGSSSQGSSIGNEAGGATLRPALGSRQVTVVPIPRGGADSAALRPPREPSKALLLPNADMQLREEELSMMYEELGYQAETMLAMLMGMLPDDDGSEGGSVDMGRAAS
ncbi:kinase-like protein [Microthyrium microscopicum]|uniref:non-specific serine/threonine protein kinase n=1 Tax=Microthyrium microscopicum TaxID=703497 RepID=A0A6A6UQL1_9PEZI|nr:kinase-like protein [Microthyrium microscopicum]